jgi:hypothetical protein
MARWHWLLSAALAAAAVSSGATVQAADDDTTERPVTLDEIPAPARDAIQRHVGTGTLLRVVEETGPGGETEYGGRIYFGSYKLIIWVDAEGNILGLHRIA